MLGALLGLVASLVAASTAGAQDATEPAKSSFTDVAGHWAVDQIVELEGEGIFDGTECGEGRVLPERAAQARDDGGVARAGPRRLGP